MFSQWLTDNESVNSVPWSLGSVRLEQTPRPTRLVSYKDRYIGSQSQLIIHVLCRYLGVMSLDC